MPNKPVLIISVVIMLLLISFRMETEPEISFVIPEKWPQPVYDFSKNPLTEKGFQLGRRLFYDPLLSRDSTISCASCHLQFSGFTHVDHALSHGIDGRIGTRNSPVLINLAWSKVFHWDGGVNHLEVQGINPITHPKEMDNTLEEVIRRLSQSAAYSALFEEVFGDSVITTPRIMKALTQFTVSLISANSKYDKVMRQEKDVVFTSQELRGLKLFRKHCASCHTEPLFTNGGFASNGIQVNPFLKDVGRYAITGQRSDSLQFKVPTLRNIEFTFPYMHDGRYRKLKDVIRYYSDSIITRNSYMDKRLRKPLKFSEEQQKDLLSFLYTLTDKAFLFNPRFGYPR